MPIAIVERPKPMGDIAKPPRVKFTRDDLRAMMQAGILTEGPFELIEGEIVYKMGINQPHVFVTHQARGWLEGVFGRDYVQSENPIALGAYNEPEPDIAVLQNDRRHYLTAGTPPAADVRLVIEVADATLPYDRGTKAHMYADAGIADYWVMDVTGRQVFVHRDPQNGVYQSITTHSETDRIAPLAAPNSSVLISTLLP